MNKRAAATTIALTLAAVISPVMVGVAEAAPPPGCTLQTIDGGRTSYAKCSAPNSYVHWTQCTWGGNSNLYIRPFTRSHLQSCPSGYRVSAHAIYLA